jgi:hypothetical protein
MKKLMLVALTTLALAAAGGAQDQSALARAAVA